MYRVACNVIIFNSNAILLSFERCGIKMGRENIKLLRSILCLEYLNCTFLTKIPPQHV